MGFITFCSSAQSAEQSLTNSLAETVRLRKGEILGLMQASKAKELEFSGLPLKVTLDRIDKNSDAQLVTDFLSGLMLLGLNSNRIDPGKEYVREKVIIECFLTALHDSRPSVRFTALTYLSDYLPPKQLRGYIKDLISAWQYFKPNQDFMILIGSTDTDEAKAFLTELVGDHVPVPDEVKAKIGDLALEHQLINQFGSEATFNAKSSLALKLGYIATPASICALCQEMRSPLVLETQETVVSIRYNILEALKKAFPEDDLFSEKFREVLKATKYQDVEDGEQYIDQVEKWCHQRCGTTWQSPRPPFLLRRMKGIAKSLPH